jgi:predicted dehydrogenase
VTVRWGFLGAGYVASRAMAPAVHRSDGATLYGVASRDRARSLLLEPTVAFDSYEDLIRSDDIDAVYISLTNGQHCHWVVEALDAGKHVLCEKPLAMNAGEVDRMHLAAQRAGRSVVEAVWVRWHPRHRRFTDIVRSGVLGESVHLESAFTFSSDMTDNYRLRPEHGGGALLDVGCYQVHTWLAALGAEIPVTSIDCDRLVGPTGVDLTTRTRATLGSTASADMTCSFVEDLGQFLVARGSECEISMLDGEAFTSWREPSSLRLGDTIESFAEADAFVLMVEQVSRHFAGEEPPLFDPHETLRVAQILDRIAGAPSV